MSQTGKLPDDEMYDSETDLKDPGPLGEYLRACEERLLKPYSNADTKAMVHQRTHRWLVLAAGATATTSLVLTIFNTVFHAAWHPGLWLELAISAVTVLLVLVGLSGHWHKKWLLRRYQAERYRLLKFEGLIDPAKWGCGPSRDWRSELEADIDRIERLRYLDLEDRAREEQVPSLPEPGSCEGFTAANMQVLTDYYVRRRLVMQMKYFQRASRKAKSVWLNPVLLPVVFFLSMGLLLIHLGVDLWEVANGVPQHSPSNEILLLLALAIPALWAGIHLWFTANEASRNSNRSLAKLSALQQIASRLGANAPAALKRLRETMEPPVRDLLVSSCNPELSDSTLVLGNIAVSEYILGTDQHEWLRLMLEAEWYR
jgi:hypothetical protein